MTAFVGYWVFVAGVGTGWLICALFTRRDRDA